VDKVLADARAALDQVVHRRADERRSGAILEAVRYHPAERLERRARRLRRDRAAQLLERAVRRLVVCVQEELAAAGRVRLRSRELPGTRGRCARLLKDSGYYPSRGLQETTPGTGTAG
jgi:hypothetical protein